MYCIPCECRSYIRQTGSLITSWRNIKDMLESTWEIWASAACYRNETLRKVLLDNYNWENWAHLAALIELRLDGKTVNWEMSFQLSGSWSPAIWLLADEWIKEKEWTGIDGWWVLCSWGWRLELSLKAQCKILKRLTVWKHKNIFIFILSRKDLLCIWVADSSE